MDNRKEELKKQIINAINSIDNEMILNKIKSFVISWIKE